MIPAPATTPIKPRQQVLFGLGVAGVYGVLQLMQVAFGLFFTLVLVCGVRGLMLYLAAARRTFSPVAAS